MLRSLIKPLNLPLDEDQQTGWKVYPLFSGSTLFVDGFSSHISVLSQGAMPHQLHAHIEEELFIMLSGEADLITLDKNSHENETRNRLYPGSFAYNPPLKHHTIHNTGQRPATYLMFKWYNKKGTPEVDTRLTTTILRYDDDATNIDPTIAQGIVYKEILAMPTAYFSKLHSHVTILQKGAGYQPHRDIYDVAILLIKGTVETLGHIVKAPGVIYYAAGKPHGIINKGECDAFYLVFEFHGKKKKLMGYSLAISAFRQLRKVHMYVSRR